ncbi:class I SAM-dependent methyltransferase [Methanocaldococcus sp.]
MRLSIDVNSVIENNNSFDDKLREEDVKKIIDEVIHSTIPPEDTKLRKKIEYLDATIEYLNYEMITTFLEQGVEFGILTLVDRYNPKLEELPNIIKYPNKDFVIDYINTAIKLGILYADNDKIKINEDYEIKIKMPKFGKVINDFIMKYNFITHIARYALISYNHPKIAINFKRDPDIWDMILSSEYFNLHREIPLELLKIENDSYILDLGCGSRSPSFYTDYIFPRGYYMGIDISNGMLEIAKNRLKKLGLDCYELKCLDILTIIPKEKYDYAICSHILKYIPSLKIALNKIMKSIKPGGKVYVAEEFILDKNTNNIHVELFEFYNKLNNRFNKFYSKEEIENIIEKLGYDARIEKISKGIVVIEKI